MNTSNYCKQSFTDIVSMLSGGLRFNKHLKVQPITYLIRIVRLGGMAICRWLGYIKNLVSVLRLSWERFYVTLVIYCISHRLKDGKSYSFGGGASCDSVIKKHWRSSCIYKRKHVHIYHKTPTSSNGLVVIFELVPQRIYWFLANEWENFFYVDKEGYSEERIVLQLISKLIN